MAEATTPNFPLRAALIVDGPTLPAWAVDAVIRAAAGGRMQVVAVFLCTNNISKKRLLKNLGYYAMRALLVRPAAWRARPLADIVGTQHAAIPFAADIDGIWQRVPVTLHQRAAALDLDVVIKFGMGLLRDPHQFPSRFGVLSYHHGDPTCYRGRPAGFYEVYDDASHVGAVVQRLTNRLDGGEFLAQGRFRMERHSYQATLESLYTGSSFLLEKALAACVQPQPAPALELGRNHRLPGNLTMCRFLAKLLFRKATRLAYGAFWRKAWRLFEIDRTALGDLNGDRLLHGTPLPLPPDAEFLADPFYLDPQGEHIVCERMPTAGVHGDLVRVTADRAVAEPLVVEHGRHLSYPHVLRMGKRLFLLPEVADWSGPILIELDPMTGALMGKIPLQGLQSERLLDPTMLEHQGTFWLFATPAEPYRKMDTLMLWRSSHLEGPYEPHPMNPVALNPATARSAGRIFSQNGRLLRFGQDNSKNYGAGLAVLEILELTQSAYRERQVGSTRWQGWQGPHTIDFSSATVVLDGYKNSLYLLAWASRMRYRIAKLRPPGSIFW